MTFEQFQATRRYSEDIRKLIPRDTETTKAIDAVRKAGGPRKPENYVPFKNRMQLKVITKDQRFARPRSKRPISLPHVSILDEE
jgi:hypothetical protein